MEPNKNIQMTPEAWRQYCLLTRRLEWLRESHSRWYRVFPERLDDLNSRYADVSMMDTQAFSAALANSEEKS